MASGVRRGNVVRLKEAGAGSDGPHPSSKPRDEKPDPAILNMLIGDAAQLAREVERLGGPPQASALASIADAVSRGDLAGAAERRDYIRRQLQSATDLQAKRRKDRIIGWTIMVFVVLGIVVPLLR